MGAVNDNHISSMPHLQTWLERHGLEDQLDVLAQNDIEIGLLEELTEEDLREMGFSIGQRRRFFRALDQDPPSNCLSVAPADTGSPIEPTAERRQMTVMFCDLVGSTEIAAESDPEATSELLQRYTAEVSRAIVEHGGHVAKFLGDGVLAYFGWPRADEDAAARAVKAGLAAVARVSKLDSARGPLTARVGIATGPVVVSDLIGEGASERGAIAGPTPNLAARLEACAEPGEVVIHDVPRRLTGALFELEPRGAAHLKGFSEPVEIWRVLGPAREATRFDARRSGRLTAFVGRESESSLLADRWRRARDGEGQAVLLSGEAGIGKSRILREFRRMLAADGETTLLQLQCSPDEVDTAFSPFARELAAGAGIAPGDPAERQAERFDAHLRTLFADPALAGALLSGLVGLPAERYPPLEMASQRRQQATIHHLAERIQALARDVPVVLLAEDLHWADPSSLATLDALVAGLDDAAVLVVATTRPGFQPDWIHHGSATFYSLNRLSREAGRAITVAVAGGKALPDEVVTQIIARTDGVPLFVEELTKAILEAGLLREFEDRFELNGQLPVLAIPSTLQDSLMARIDRMAPIKQVLQAAACLGREFERDLLAEVVDRPPAELADALEQLIEAELVFRRTRAGGDRFIFKHALVQDAAQATLLSGQRQVLHQRIADALERQGGTDQAVLARHCLEAGHAQRAAKLYLEAGNASMSASALDEAISAFEKGLEALGGVEAEARRDRLELGLRVGLGTTRMARFGWAHEAVAEAMEPAVELAGRFGDSDALCSLLWGLWVHFQTRAEFPRAWHWLARLEDLSADAPGSDLAIVKDMSVGCQHFWEADYARALFHTDRLAAVYDRDRHSRITRLTNHDPLVFSQHWAGSLADWIAGYPDRSVERMEEALTLARRIGHPFNLVFALTAGVTALYYLGRGEALLACNDEAAEVAAREALGPFSEHVNILQWRGAAMLLRGDPEEAYRLVKTGNDFWLASGGRICTAMFRSWIAEALVALSRFSEARTLNESNIAHCRQTGDRYMEPECLRLRGAFLAAAGADPTEVEASFREAIRVAEEHGAQSWRLRAATSLADLLVDRERRSEAEAVLAPALEYIEGGSSTCDVRLAHGLLEKIG